MHAAAVRYDLHIPGARSLKERRAVVRPIVDGLRHRFRCSVAEVGAQDRWQRAVVGVAVVASGGEVLDELLDGVDRWVHSRPDIEVIGVETAYLDPEAD